MKLKSLSVFLMGMLFGTMTLFAQSGKNVEFDGTSRYMTIPHHADFNFSTSEEFTITFWLNVNAYVTNARFISKRSAGNANDKSGYELWGSSSAANFYALNTPNPAGTNTFSVWGTKHGSTNKWIHIAMVVSGTGADRVVYQYQDGEVTQSSKKANKDVSSYQVTNTEEIMIGKGKYGGGVLNGKIDNLRFYKKALTQAEIEADKTSTVSADTEGLIAAYDFETTTATTVADITGNHPATLHNFPTPGNVTIKDAIVSQDINFTGRGNKNEEILKVKITTNGNQATNIQQIKIKMDGTTDISDVAAIKVYNTKSTNTFDPRNPIGKRAILVASAEPQNGEITLMANEKIYGGINHLWLTYDLKDTAKEGNKVDAQIISITTDQEVYNFENGNPTGSREILLGRTLVFAPGDYGSKNYRIPAIITANDGALVVVTDKRKNNSVDLPHDIDIVVRRSTDNGKTWTQPVTMARGKGYGKGYGDAVVMKHTTGKLVALYVGGPGLWDSNPTNPMRTYISTSDDNGLRWTAPRDITSQIYGEECTNEERKKWQGLFFGSGHGLCTNSGRLMAVVAVRVPNMHGLQNYTVYSDDQGETWKVSKLAIRGGDEAKVIQLNNGDIIMSSRTGGNRLWARSTDEGVNWGAKNSWSDIWGNACDADIVRYTSTNDGYDKNRILHTLPNNSKRTNVTMWISYDETSTWPIKKTICPGTSAYSSITILPNGTIGVYLEEDESNPYKMYYLNFSLDWLTDGADSYTTAGTEIVATPTFSLAGGKYPDTQTLKITSETPNATIYYTTDGSTPSKDATRYTTPIEIGHSMTIKAIAIKEKMANSVITQEEYIIGWSIPNQARAVGADRYVVSATTEGAIANLNYAADTPPNSYYILHDGYIETEQGSTFTLKLEGLKNQEDGLQWCQAIILVDWNRDLTFTSDERIILGDRIKNNGNTVLSISQPLTVPKNAYTEKPTRIRVVYSDGWRSSNYTDFGEDPIDKGRCYDFELKINKKIESTTNDLTVDKLLVSPNPVKSVLNIALPYKSDYKISLIALDGKILTTKTVNTDKYALNLSSYKSSVYLLKIKDNKGFDQTLQLIKE